MRASITGLVAAFAAIVLTGCPNPNAIGVQDTGSISAHCQLATGQPVAGALVAASSTNTCTTGSDGSCLLTQVPVGPQVVTAHAPGLDADPTNAQVTVGQTSSVTLTMKPSNG